MAQNPFNARIRAIEEANGRAFISSPLSEPVRAECRILATDAGIPASTAAKLSDGDLCSLYAVARTTPTRVLETAQRIARKAGAVNPLLEPAPAPQPPVGKPPYNPSPSAPTYKCDECGRSVPKGLDCPHCAPIVPDPAAPTVEVDLEALSAVMRKVARDEAQAATDGLQRELDEALAGIPEIAADAARQALSALQPTNLIVTLPSAEPVALGTVHYKTPDIIKALAAGVNVYLYGPAGSGKTTAGQKVAEAFKLHFYFAAKVESEYMLLGFKDARGETVRTQFREAYEHGGVFLFDELDGSSPAAVVALNAALANGICPFPDGIVARHPDFKCIAAGNTKLAGADLQYVGRSQLDAASIDRFVFIEFGYDSALETALATRKDWVQYVQAIRAAIEARGFEKLVTPRATIDGCKLLEAGFTWDQACDMAIWKGLDPDTIDAICTAVGEA